MHLLTQLGRTLHSLLATYQGLWKIRKSSIGPQPSAYYAICKGPRLIVFGFSLAIKSTSASILMQTGQATILIASQLLETHSSLCVLP